MLIDISYDSAASRAVVKRTWKETVDLFSTVRFAPTRSLEAVGAYAMELLKLRYGTNLPTAKKALTIAQSCVASRLVRAFDAAGFEGLLLRDGSGVAAACFGCTTEERTCFSDFGASSVFIVLDPEELTGFFRPTSTFLCTRVLSAPAPPDLTQSSDAEMDKNAWRKLAQDVFAKYEAFHADRAKTPFKLDLSFDTPIVNFFVELSECLIEGLDDDESDVDFQFVDEAIDLFVCRYGARQGDMTGALAAVRGIIKKFSENTCCPCCKWRQDAERIMELAEEYCEAEEKRRDFQMDLKRGRADAAAFRLLQEEALEKKRLERKEKAVPVPKTTPTDEPLPRTVEELRALVSTRERAMQKARAAVNKLAANKKASKAERQAASARVQGAHAAREAAVNALSRAERRERERVEREEARAREEKSAAAAERAAAERAEREAVDAANEADRLALRLQRAELLVSGGLRDASTAPVPVPVPVPVSVLAPAPMPMRAPIPVPLSVAMTALLPVPLPVPKATPVSAWSGVKLLPAHMRPLPPPPQQQQQYHYATPWIPLMETHYVHNHWGVGQASAIYPGTPSPQSTSPRYDDVGSAETDSTCIVCMDAACDVTTTCCTRTFMCATCSARVKRCPLCDSLEFVCLPDELL